MRGVFLKCNSDHVTFLLRIPQQVPTVFRLEILTALQGTQAPSGFGSCPPRSLPRPQPMCFPLVPLSPSALPAPQPSRPRFFTHPALTSEDAASFPPPLPFPVQTPLCLESLHSRSTSSQGRYLGLPRRPGASPMTPLDFLHQRNLMVSQNH